MRELETVLFGYVLPISFWFALIVLVHGIVLQCFLGTSKSIIRHAMGSRHELTIDELGRVSPFALKTFHFLVDWLLRGVVLVGAFTVLVFALS